MSETEADYLVVAYADHECVWCHAITPAGIPLELIVSHGDKRWWACQPCAVETRVTAVERTTA